MLKYFPDTRGAVKLSPWSNHYMPGAQKKTPYKMYGAIFKANSLFAF